MQKWSIPWSRVFFLAFLTVLVACTALLPWLLRTPANPEPSLSTTIPFPLMPFTRIALEKDHPTFSSRFSEETRALLPRSANLWTRDSARRILVDDQGRFGSCTAHAMSYAFQLYLLTKPAIPFSKPSRAYWYAYSRILLGDNLKYDLGSTNGTTVQALRQYGWIAEPLWPYTQQNIYTRPSTGVTAQAQRQKTALGTRLTFTNNTSANTNSIKVALAAGKAVLVGIYVYASFMQQSVLRTGTIVQPNPRRERLLGGHAIALTGYDDTAQRFYFRNSWGSSVGQQGMFTIPYSYISNPGLTGDIWAI